MYIAILIFLVFLILGMPVAFSIGLSGFAFFLIRGLPLSILVQKSISTSQSFTMLAIPLFILAGNLMNSCGITKRLTRFCNACTGHMWGNMGQVSCLLSTFMGGVSGSAAADAAMECRILGPEMERLGYSKGWSAAKQTLSGFYAGKSKPRCQELAEVFLQLRLSERSGRGVIRILDKYGKKAFEIKEDYIKITIPFSYERQFGNKLNSDKKNNVSLNKSEKNKEKIFMEIKNNPDITTTQLMEIVKLGKTSVQKYIKELTNEKRIYRKGSRKTGQWSFQKTI